MIVLVDFENTHVSGLDGYEYLDEHDTMVMYYSDENSSVTKGIIDDLKKNRVNVSLVKLLKQHSNALDMYIASTTGMFLDSGEKILIVSKDKGYGAVRDFWHSLRGAEILLGETIKECLLHSMTNDDDRIRICKERSQKANLVEAFSTMNTIPTRPALSRGMQRLREKAVNWTETQEAAPILPNPLDKRAQNTDAVQQGTVTEGTNFTMTEAPSEAVENTVSASTEDAHHNDHKRDRHDRYRGPRHLPVTPKTSTDEFTHGGYDGLPKVTEDAAEKGTALIREEQKSTAVTVRNEEASKAAGEALKEGKPEGSKDMLGTLAKKVQEGLERAAGMFSKGEHQENIETKETEKPKVDPNRIQYVYDPVTKKFTEVIDGKPVKAEEKKEEAAAEKEETTKEKTEAVTDVKEQKTGEKAPSKKEQETNVEKSVQQVKKESEASATKTQQDEADAKAQEEYAHPEEHSGNHHKRRRRTAGKNRGNHTEQEKAVAAVDENNDVAATASEQEENQSESKDGSEDKQPAKKRTGGRRTGAKKVKAETEKTEKTEQSEKTEKSAKSGKSGKSENSEVTEKSEASADVKVSSKKTTKRTSNRSQSSRKAKTVKPDEHKENA